ncbi:MAG: ATP-dependent sacrificial sulfur transferase LarE [Nitrospirae bacterium]|nr:ATP-dependent sacrificial sulfur transferase LarE [Nitrospirota bacterium]
MEEKFNKLKDIIRDMGSLLIAYSGGVDSTFLLKAASDMLRDRVAAVTAESPTYPELEVVAAKETAKKLGVRHLLISSNELEIGGFASNPTNRCYFCKKELFEKLKAKAGELGLNYVADGSNYDDIKDYRPGRDAAKELGIRSPLVEAGLTKAEIRGLAKRLNLPNWDKPSFACLSSRFPYGTEITIPRLRQIENCENIIREMGFRQFRVRYHNEIARIEVGQDELQRFFDGRIRDYIVRGFMENGFTYITLDLQGYRTGSMNQPVLRGGNKHVY